MVLSFVVIGFILLLILILFIKKYGGDADFETGKELQIVLGERIKHTIESVRVNAYDEIRGRPWLVTFNCKGILHVGEQFILVRPTHRILFIRTHLSPFILTNYVYQFKEAFPNIRVYKPRNLTLRNYSRDLEMIFDAELFLMQMRVCFTLAFLRKTDLEKILPTADLICAP